MSFDLSGMRVLVTGGSRGIGKAIAQEFVGAGAEVVISGTNPETLKKAVEEIGAASFVAADLADKGAVKGMIEEVGAVDVLVNNAGITKDGLFLRMSDEQWQDVMRVNVDASMQLARGLLPAMLKKRAGRIINITSVVAHMGNVGQANYVTSKAAITGFSKALATEVARKGITVNCVAPGFIETAMTDEISEDATKKMLEAIPAKRFGQPSEVAHAVLFLASKEAGYVTGSTLHVNGGMYV